MEILFLEDLVVQRWHMKLLKNLYQPRLLPKILLLLRHDLGVVVIEIEDVKVVAVVVAAAAAAAALLQNVVYHYYHYY